MDVVLDRELTVRTDCSKAKSEYLDPCQEAAERSIRCLNRNGGDRKMCNTYFEYVTSRIRPNLGFLQEEQNMEAEWTLTGCTGHIELVKKNGYV